MTAFLAQVDSNTSDSPSPLEFSQSWALTAFAWALEGNGNAGGPSELAVRLACIWIIYDADKLWFKALDSQAEQNTFKATTAGLHYEKALFRKQALCDLAPSAKPPVA